MKKIIALILAITCIFTFNPFPGEFAGIEVSASENSDTGVVVLLEEDFEDENIGDNLHDLSGWKHSEGGEGNVTEYTIQQESESNPNKVVHMRKTQNSGALHYDWKPFTESVTEGIVNVKFRLQKVNANAKIFLMHFLKETTGTVICSSNIYLTNIETGKWVDVEFFINVTNMEFTRTLKYKNAADEDVTESAVGTITASKISAVTLSLNRTGALASSTGGDGEFFVDDLYVKKLPALKITSVKATEKDNTKEVLVSFNNDIEETVLTGDLTVLEKGAEDDADAEIIESISPYNGSKKEFLVEFENPLKFGTEYEFSFSGLKDEYGNAPETVEGSFTTRAARTNIEASFYEDYVDYDNKTPLDAIQIGENTAEIVVTNEKESPFNGIAAMVHKSVEGTVKDATAIPLSVDGEKENVPFELTLNLTEKETGDRIELFLMDIEYNPISGVRTFSDEGINISSYINSTATDITVDASILDARDDGATMKVTGQVTPEEESDVIIFTLKSGKTISDLEDLTKFKDCVEYIGQTVTEEDGTYELSYDFINESTMDVVYSLYAYSTGAQAGEDSVKFFPKAFMEETLLPAVQNADKEGIKALLDKDNPSLIGSESLASVLGIDLTDYHSLQPENKDKVCEYLANDSFDELPEIADSGDIQDKSAITKVDDIKPIIKAVILHQKTKETSERALLESIDAADWEEIQEILTAAENKNILDLPWEESYAVIKDDSTAVENFFKALADDTKYPSFISGTNAEGFALLRTAFEAEAKAQIGNISVFYVSPRGDDENPGTKAAPWKSLYKAAQSLTAGQTAIFENGTYVETEYTEFANAGIEGSPITIKAENKHGAVIKYAADLRLQKLRVHKSYIQVKDFIITQEEKSTASSQRPTLDILLECGYGKYQPLEGCVIDGNRFYNVYEEGIKVKYTKNAVIKDNIIEEPDHEGIDSFANDGAVISGNTILSPGRVGVMVKGNSRNCLVYNNEVSVAERNCTAAFTVGGQSDSTSPYDVAEGTGYEAYNCVFLNNIAYTKEGATLNTGYSFTGAYNCYAFNNISSGVVTGFSFGNASDERNGWGWDPPTVNPTLYNNIVINATNGYTGTLSMETYTSSHNLFYNVKSNVIDETGIVKKDPGFVNPEEGDFHLSAQSPARKAGTTLPAEVSGYSGISGIDTIDSERTIKIPAVDFEGVSRLTPYDMGAYNRSAAGPSVLLYEDFEDAAAGDALNGYNSWKMYGNGTNSTNDTKIITKYEDETAAVKNKVAAISRTRTPGGDSVLMWGYKLLDEAQSSGVISLEFKLKVKNLGAQLLKITLTGSNGTAVIADRDLGFSGLGIEANKTYLMKLTVDIDNGKISIYKDGVLKSSTTLKNYTPVTIAGVAFGSARNNTSIVKDAEFYIDDIYVYKIDELNITSIVPTEDDNVTEAIVSFNNDVEESSIDCGNITVRGISGEGINDLVSVKSAVPYNGKQSEYKLTFAQPLEFGTVYSISFAGITDKYGNTPGNGKVLCNYETREARMEIGEVNFYKNYKTSKNKINSLQNGEITAEIIVTNEKTASVDAFMIMAYKSEKGTIKDITAQKIAVSQGQKDIKFTTTLNVTSKQEGDNIELILIDNLSSFQPLKGSIVLASDISENEFRKNNLTKPAVDATIINATNLGATLKVDGTVTPETEGELLLMVMKPGKKLSNLTGASDFKSCVDFIGQGNSGSDGKFSLSYDLQCSTDNTLYNFFVSAYGATELANGSVKFFRKDFMDGILTAVKGASEQELLNMLKKEEPTLLGGYDSLAGILGVDLTDYHKLQEPEKVCQNLIAKKNELLTVEDIKPMLSELILSQKNKEADDALLITSIDNADWGTLQDILTKQENQDTLLLPWTGNYNTIKNNSTSVENLYKALARDYTFTSATNKEGFIKLRTAFNEEAGKLIGASGGGSGSSGGGGGGSMSVGKDIDKSAPPTPINKEELTEKTPVFTDLADYRWAEEAINSLAADKIVNGTGNDTFEPGRLVYREEFVKMIVLAFNLYDEKAVSTGFMDVKQTDWFAPYVASAVKHGIINGVDNSHFGVQQQLSRAEMATILYRAATIKGISLETDGGIEFADGADIPGYAAESVKALTEAGILNGMGNGMFEPYSKTNRAMAAKVIHILRKER